MIELTGRNGVKRTSRYNYHAVNKKMGNFTVLKSNNKDSKLQKSFP